MTEPDQLLKYVPLEEIRQHELEGWVIAAAYQRAEHHLRYSVPMFKDLEDES